MSNIEEYQSAVRTCALVAQMLAQHDIPQLLRDIGRADLVGPLLDPTLWLAKHQAMLEDKSLLEAALGLHGWATSRRRT